jgi:DNA-binding XRE family transcriptional regulator
MAPLPTMSLRAPPEHHALIRSTAARLRTDPAFLGTLAALLDAGTGPAVRHDDRLDALERRIAALEAAMQGDTDGATQCGVLRSVANDAGPGEPVHEVKPAPAAPLLPVEVVPAEGGSDNSGYQRHDDAPAAPADEVEPVQDEPPLFSLPPAAATVESMTFGARLRVSREAAGLSRPTLGERLGVSREAVRLWETGKTPTPENMAALVALLPVLAEG